MDPEREGKNGWERNGSGWIERIRERFLGEWTEKSIPGDFAILHTRFSYGGHAGFTSKGGKGSQTLELI